MMSTKHVHVTSGQGQVDLASINVSKSALDEVVWFSYSSQAAMIVFASPNGSPFNETTFYIPAGGSVSSGPPVKPPDAAKEYKYFVVGQTGVTDPVVIIDP
jgi:hypothetical protein